MFLWALLVGVFVYWLRARHKYTHRKFTDGLFWSDLYHPVHLARILASGPGACYASKILVCGMRPREWFLVSLISAIFFYYTNCMKLYSLFAYASIVNICPSPDVWRKLFWGILGIPSILWPDPGFVVLNLWLIFLWETESLHPIICEYIDRLEEEFIKSAYTGFHQPLIRNSEGVPVLQDIARAFQALWDFLVTSLSGGCEAYYLRTILVQKNRDKFPGIPRLDVKTTMDLRDKVLNMWTTFWYCSVIVGFALGVSMSNGAVVFGLLILMFAIGELDSKTRSIETPSLDWKDGNYRVIRRTYFGLTSARGIGFGYKGVLHVPYHVCGGTPLRVGDVYTYPYYINKDLDLVTYGGPSQMANPIDGETIYALLQNEDSQTTAELTAVANDGILICHAVSAPSQSGSPIVAVREGSIVVVGITGNVLNLKTDQIEFSMKPQSLPEIPVRTEDEEIVNFVTQYPGSGKTHYVIPKLAKDLLKRHKKILITGPTRVVCREIKSSLSQHFSDQDVSIIVKNSIRRLSRAKIQVAAHATAISLLLNSDPCMREVGAFIIDESHTDDVSTKLLVEYCDAKNIKAFLLSATHPHKMDDKSNYPIEDIQIEDSQIEVTVAKCMQSNLRTILFVPTVSGANGVQSYARKLRTFDPILLYRENFEKAKNELSDLQRRLIISTNIAECGLNADIDVVIDTCKVYVSTWSNGVGSGGVVHTTHANRIQRRGRCGRTKAGAYYYTRYPTKNVEEDTYATNVSREIAIMLGWKEGNLTSPMLTLKQLQRMWQANLGLLETWMEISPLGYNLPKDERIARYEELTRGNKKLSTCMRGISACPCLLFGFKWWEDSYHDKFVCLHKKIDSLEHEA